MLLGSLVLRLSRESITPKSIARDQALVRILCKEAWNPISRAPQKETSLPGFQVVNRYAMALQDSCRLGANWAWTVPFIHTGAARPSQLHVDLYDNTLQPLGRYHFFTRRRRRIGKMNSRKRIPTRRRIAKTNSRSRIPSRSRISPRRRIAKTNSPRRIPTRRRIAKAISRRRIPPRRRIPKTNSPKPNSPRSRIHPRRRIAKTNSPKPNSPPQPNSLPKTNFRRRIPTRRQIAKTIRWSQVLSGTRVPLMNAVEQAC